MLSRWRKESPFVTELTQEDLTEQIEAELERLTVADVLLHTVTTVASLAYRQLGSEEGDLAQVRLAIDSLTAVVPRLEHEVPDELLRDFRQVIANLQLAYAGAATHAG